MLKPIAVDTVIPQFELTLNGSRLGKNRNVVFWVKVLLSHYMHFNIFCNIFITHLISYIINASNLKLGKI